MDVVDLFDGVFGDDLEVVVMVEVLLVLVVIDDDVLLLGIFFVVLWLVVVGYDVGFVVLVLGGDGGV